VRLRRWLIARTTTIARKDLKNGMKLFIELFIGGFFTFASGLVMFTVGFVCGLGMARIRALRAGGRSDVDDLLRQQRRQHAGGAPASPRPPSAL
jgi:hypothetical protein